MNTIGSHFVISVSNVYQTFDTVPGKHVHCAEPIFEVVVIGDEKARKVFALMCEKFPHPQYIVTSTSRQFKRVDVQSNHDC